MSLKFYVGVRIVAALCGGAFVCAIAMAEAEKTSKPEFEPAKADIMTLDPLSKKEPRKDVQIEYVEQKGTGPGVFPDANGKKNEGVQKLSEMCELYEGKIIAFAGSTSLVEKCRQRVIEDTQVLNELIIERKTQVVDVPSQVVRTIPFGNPFEQKSVKITSESKGKLCKKMEGRYVTNDGETFFFVEKCSRRPFVSFEDFTHHNIENRPVLAATLEDVEALPLGSTMAVKASSESSVLYKVDGDIYWSRLFPAGRVDRLGEDSLKKIEEIDAERFSSAKRSDLCARYEGKIVSFYSRLFRIEKCLRRPLLNMSLEVQASFAEDFGPQDLSAEQYRAIPEGEGLDAEVLLKKGKSVPAAR